MMQESSVTNAADAVPLAGEAKVLLTEVRELILSARQSVAQTVNSTLTMLYWEIGRRIRQDVLQSKRAGYGAQIVAALGRQLERDFGRGFGEKNLQSMLFERTALSKKPEKLMAAELKKLREEDKLSPDLVFRDPYLLDFLGLKDTYAEKDLEAAILREIESFILELGVGFCFVARQKRMQIDGRDYYLDLLFYHRKLRRLVAIDLKIGNFEAADKGQMELYLNRLKRYECEPDEAEPLGMILCAGKSDEHVELMDLQRSGIHPASYLTQLLPKEQLEQKLHEAVRLARLRLQTIHAGTIEDPSP